MPTLAVEILSPSDTVEQINEKLALYRRFCVGLAWMIDPYVQLLRDLQTAGGGTAGKCYEQVTGCAGKPLTPDAEDALARPNG